MTDDLNERCAMAMGWTSLRIERLRRPGGISGGGGYPGGGDYWESLCGNPPDGSSPPPLIRHVPKFDSNPATIPEMAAWLHANGVDNVQLNSWRLGNDGKPGASAVGIEDDDWTTSYVEGATLNEALARLVCAVAEARKQ